MTQLDRDIVAASVLIDHKPYIRANKLAKMLGAYRNAPDYWQRVGVATPHYFKVPVTQRDNRGVGVFYDLTQVKAVVEFHRSKAYKAWDEVETATLRHLIGIRSIRNIAAVLGRTEFAVKLKMASMGWSLRKTAEQEHRLVGSRRLAELAGRNHSTIKRWVEWGCPAKRLAGGLREYGFDLREVREWLKTKWNICVGFSPETLHRLRLRLDNGRAIDARKEREAA